MTRFYARRGKRALDVALAVPLLLLALPVIVLAALAVALTLGRPVFHRQARIGLHGQPFAILKLRTMRDGPGDDAARTPPLGRWLRLTSIDELPQLMQVLAGRMSLVGPRPLPVAYAPLLPPGRDAVRPGLTGPAQLAGRNALPWSVRLRLDLAYAAAPTLRGDLHLLWRTPATVWQGTGVLPTQAVALTPRTATDG